MDQEHHHKHAHHHITEKKVVDPVKKPAKNQHHDHGHDKHAGHHTEDFLKKFWVSLIVTIPILLLSHMIQDWFNFNIRFRGDNYVLLALGSFIYIYGGMPFLKGMVAEIKHKAIGMMTLVAIAITVAFVYSVAVVLGLPGMDFFWELATLIVIMLLGHWLEMKSQAAASDALRSLASLLPSIVHVEENGSTIDKDIRDLKQGDIVHIRPGENLPADGVIIDGNSYVNESMLTGESMPVQKVKKDNVIAGSVNGDGYLKVLVHGAGESSYLNKVIKLVESAQAGKSNTQNLADKVARWLTYVSISTGIITFFVWYINHDLAFALERMVTVMVTACPHALGVAIPLVVAISTTAAATNGLLIRNRTAFENARKITTVLFDKTGTLTKGSHEVQQVITLSDNLTKDQILSYAASVEQFSEHYIGRGVMKYVSHQQVALQPASDFQYIQGVGVSAIVNDKKVIAAGPNYFGSNRPMPAIPTSIDQSRETLIFIMIDDQPAGIITLADTIRENSKEAIQQLKSMGISSHLITGDNDQVAAAVSHQLKMDGYKANVLPHQKQEVVSEFQARGEVVAMTGDGVNDAPALASADVGIAVGSGTDVAAETADILLVNSDPIDVANMISYGRKTYQKMIQNLGWALGYNIIAIPLAAGVLYPHFVLSPALGAVLMSLSTIIVAINAKLLRFERHPNYKQ